MDGVQSGKGPETHAVGGGDPRIGGLRRREGLWGAGLGPGGISWVHGGSWRTAGVQGAPAERGFPGGWGLLPAGHLRGT